MHTLDIHRIYYVYITVLHKYINVCTYNHLQCKSLYSVFSWSRYGPDPRSFHVVEKEALGEIFLFVLRSPLCVSFHQRSIILQMLTFDNGELVTDL
jgi:hypothetical protein